MLGKVLGLPVRLVKRVKNLMDGERSAPAHKPAVDTLVNPDLPKATDPLPPSGAAPAAAKSEAAPADKAPAKKKAAAKKKAPAKKKAAPKKKASPPPAAVQVTPEPTPNPNAMKFTVGQTGCTTGSFSFAAGDAPVAHPIARAVLAVDGVKTVFGVNDFVTVTKDDAAAWDGLVPHLVSAIGTAVAAGD